MSTDAQSGPARAALALMTDPWVLFAVAVTAVNDHVLKGAGWLPGVVTGKLSDVAGLFFFPILLAVVLSLGARYASRNWTPRRLLDAAVLLTVLGFAGVNVVEPVNALARQYWGVFTMDATDLLCLPMVFAARQYALAKWPEHGRELGPAFRWRRWLALAFAATVTVATSRPSTIDVSGFPSWELSNPGISKAAGVDIRAWFAKSGKDGAGLVLRFDGADENPHRVDVDSAHMRLSDGSNEMPEIRSSQSGSFSLEDGASAYLPFEFDNERAWNEGYRKATVTVQLRVDGSPVELSYDAIHRSRSAVATYQKYGRWVQTQPLAKELSPEELSDDGTWGPDPKKPGVQRTGPNLNCKAEYLRRDPERPEQLRVRFPYDASRCKEGDDE